LGCKYSVSNDEEHAYINLNGPDENFNEALKMVQNVLRNPMPNEKALQSLIGDILKSRENNKLNARIIQRQLSQYVMYGPNNPSTWIIKNTDLKNIKSGELLKLLKEVLMGSYEISYYGPRALEGKLKDEKIENSVLSNLSESGFVPKGFKQSKKDIPVFTERKMTEKGLYLLNQGKAKQVEVQIEQYAKGSNVAVEDIKKLFFLILLSSFLPSFTCAIVSI
jgi:hypothetical protein